MSNDYIALKIDGKRIDEHRLIWEKAYGEIPEGYIIHHIDGNKSNNDLSNLQMMSREEHSRLHGKLNSNLITPKKMSEEQYKKWYEANKESKKSMSFSIIDGKTLCRKCNELLPVECFSKNKRMANGCEPFCKKCRSEYRKQKKEVS